MHDKYCFFFSSRRRHTRYWRDWSSDVCSSDLQRDGAGRTNIRATAARLGPTLVETPFQRFMIEQPRYRVEHHANGTVKVLGVTDDWAMTALAPYAIDLLAQQIGRAHV